MPSPAAERAGRNRPTSRKRIRAFNDYFGGSLALYGDTAVIGAEWDDHAAGNTGSAYVFVRSGTVWTEQSKLVASDAAFMDCFGISVAVEGDTAVVGSHYDDHSALSDPGSAYVFVRSGTVWSEQAKLIGATLGNADRMGISVDISGDTVFAGASRADLAGVTDAGSAWVFSRFGGSWSEEQEVVATDGSRGDQFGLAVAIDGDTAVVGALFDSFGGENAVGSGYVFVRSGDSWIRQQRLTANDADSGDGFGKAVDIEGETVIVGASEHNNSTGAAWVFSRSGTVWTEQGELVADDGSVDDRFGASVGISGDTAVVGATGDSHTHPTVTNGGSVSSSNVSALSGARSRSSSAATRLTQGV